MGSMVSKTPNKILGQSLVSYAILIFIIIGVISGIILVVGEILNSPNTICIYIPGIVEGSGICFGNENANNKVNIEFNVERIITAFEDNPVLFGIAVVTASITLYYFFKMLKGNGE